MAKLLLPVEIIGGKAQGAASAEVGGKKNDRNELSVVFPVGRLGWVLVDFKKRTQKDLKLKGPKRTHDIN